MVFSNIYHLKAAAPLKHLNNSQHIRKTGRIDGDTEYEITLDNNAPLDASYAGGIK